MTAVAKDPTGDTAAATVAQDDRARRRRGAGTSYRAGSAVANTGRTDTGIARRF